MKQLKCIFIFQLGCLYQVLQNSTRATAVPARAEEEELHRDPLIDKLPGKCSFALRMPGNGSRDVAPLMAPTDVLLEQICQDLHCGSVYQVKKRSSPPDAVCFHGCLYQDGRLQNCSRSSRSNCTLISKAVCGAQAVRLVGGWDRCAGRVELWRSGRWGTVCDDRWDLRDAGVVCTQLGCGRALGVTGEGGVFPRGRGPVHLDELNCSGGEDNLWACASAEDKNDCGHKEDAGVICSETRGVRLTGGPDRCSGKVETRRDGSWGPLCNDCWDERLASVVCAVLQCGAEPEPEPERRRLVQVLPPLVRNHSSLRCLSCPVHTQSLWECRTMDDKPHLCQDPRAAGVICNGSLGFTTVTTATTLVMGSQTTAPTTTAYLHALGVSLASPELPITIGVSLLLLVTLIINTLYCCHYRRRHAYLLKQMSSDLSVSAGRHFNSYQDGVNLTKVATRLHQTHAPSDPRRLWAELSAGDGTSADTDHKEYESSCHPSVPLSTFWSSQESGSFVNPFMKPSDFEEQVEGGAMKGTFVNYNYEATPAPFAGASKMSVNSFDTSSTFSSDSSELPEGDEDVGAEPSSDGDYDDLG